MKHNSMSFCQACQEILDRYPFFHKGLRTWFEQLQLKFPELHCCWAGRGAIAQEYMFARGASKAHFGQSAHSYNCGLDLFQLKDNQAFFTPGWYFAVVKPNLIPEINWYGDPKSPFREEGHVEWKNWKELVKQGELKLVE